MNGDRDVVYMIVDYVNIFKQLSPELATAVIAMLPVAELRVSLPIALGVYHLPFWSAYVWSVLGNLFPVLLLLYFLEPLSTWMMKRSSYAKRFFDWLFTRTRKRFEKKYITYGALALILFVAVPLPLTGGWTGAIASFLFGIPRWRAFILITLGVLIAGVVVAFITNGTIHFTQS